MSEASRWLESQVRLVPAQTTLAVGLGWLSGLLVLLEMGVVAHVADAALFHGAARAALTPSFIVLLAAVGGRFASAWLAKRAAFRCAATVKRRVRVELYAHLAAAGPLAIAREHGGEIANTVVDGVEALDAFYSRYVPQRFLAVLLPASILVVVAVQDWVSAVVLGTTALFVPVLMVLIGQDAQERNQRLWARLTRMSAYFLDVIQNLTVLKMFGASAREGEAIARVADEYRKTTMSTLRIAFVSAFMMELVTTVSIAIVAILAGLRMLSGHLPFFPGFFVLLIAPEYFLALRTLGSLHHARMEAAAAAEHIVRLLRLTVAMSPTTTDAAARTHERRSDRHEASPVPPVIALNGVDLRYDRDVVLRGVDATVTPGERLAIVGPSGIGKSTLLMAMLGFIAPAAGRITADGVDLWSRGPQSWFARVAWLPQRPILFHGTIADNIRVARPSASDAEVAEAAASACADELIARLPDGLDTMVGERGRRLSGGQIQRIALARVFLRNADVLLLDEPTSHLDEETARAVLRSIAELTRGKTLVMITHRVGDTGICRRVLTVDGDRLVEHRHGEQTIVHDTLHAAAAPAAEAAAGVIAAASEATYRTVSIPSGETAERAPLVDPARESPNGGAQESDHADRDSVVRRLLAPAGRFWPLILAGVGVALITILSNIGLMALSSWFIAAMAIAGAAQVAFDVTLPSAGVRAFALARSAGRYGERLLNHSTTFKILAEFRVGFFRRLEPLAPAGLARFRSGDLLSRIRADVDTLDDAYVRAFVPIVVAAVSTICSALFLSRFGWSYAVINCGMLLLAGAAASPILRRVGEQAGTRVVERASVMRAETVDYCQGLAEITVLGAVSRLQEQFDADARELIHAQRRQNDVDGIAEATVSAAAGLAMTAAAFIAVPAVAGGSLAPALLPMLALFMLASVEAIAPIPAAVGRFGEIRAAARRLFEITEGAPQPAAPWTARTPGRAARSPGWAAPWSPAVAHPGERHPLSRPQAAGSAGSVIVQHGEPLCVDRLWFRYSPDTPWVLADASMRLEPGRCLTLMGPTGSGKSSLINVLMRFWDYERGSVKIGNRELRDLTDDGARASFAVAPQEIGLFHASIRENLLVGTGMPPFADRESRPRDSREAEMGTALRAAALGDLIDSLPEGIDTVVGETGLALSVGQARRLTVARALLKPAPFLLLDEPTEGLDDATADRLLSAVRAYARTQGVLIITHRERDARAADVVIRIGEGRG